MRLSTSFGLSGCPLDWLGSFSVVHGSTRSAWVVALFGLPRGSVLGLLLYIIYRPTADLGLLLATGAVLSQSYADDLQAYLHCSASEAIAAVRAMSRVMETMEAWMFSNRLHVNT